MRVALRARRTIRNEDYILIILIIGAGAVFQICLCLRKCSSVICTTRGTHIINCIQNSLNVLGRIALCQANGAITVDIALKRDNRNAVFFICSVDILNQGICSILSSIHLGNDRIAALIPPRLRVYWSKCDELTALRAAVDIPIHQEMADFLFNPVLRSAIAFAHVGFFLHTAGVVHDQDNIHRLGDTLSGDIFAFDRQCDGRLTSVFIIFGRFGRCDRTGGRFLFCRKRSCRQKGEYHHHCHQQRQYSVLCFCHASQSSFPFRLDF